VQTLLFRNERELHRSRRSNFRFVRANPAEIGGNGGADAQDESRRDDAPTLWLLLRGDVAVTTVTR
jgi:hypothetical protein